MVQDDERSTPRRANSKATQALIDDAVERERIKHGGELLALRVDTAEDRLDVVAAEVVANRKASDAQHHETRALIRGDGKWMSPKTSERLLGALIALITTLTMALAARYGIQVADGQPISPVFDTDTDQG